MILLLNNLRAYFVAALSVCLSLIVFGSGPSARAQETKAKATGEQQRGQEAEACDEHKNEEAINYRVVPQVEINIRPFKDWLAQVRDACESGQLDVDKTFYVSIGVDLASDGKLTNATMTRSEGDALAIRLAKEFVAAFYDSNALSLLVKSAEPEHLVFDIKYDSSDVSTLLSFEAPTAEKANEYAKNLNQLVTLGKFVRTGRVEAIIFKSTKVSANGKQILFNFTISRQLAGELLTKHLSST